MKIRASLPTVSSLTVCRALATRKHFPAMLGECRFTSPHRGEVKGGAAASLIQQLPNSRQTAAIARIAESPIF
jgi:hypothetical protein